MNPIAITAKILAPARTDAVHRLQREMATLPQVELPTEHFFANGMYARRLFIPAGAALVGKAHRHEHLFMLMYGDLTVWTNDGRRRIGPGEIFASRPGVKRAGFAHVDSMCVTIHRTESLDLDEIEVEIIESEPEALFDSRNKLKEIAP